MYNHTFKKFVQEGISKYYIGTGNPNAKILLIGKESAISDDDDVAKQWYQKNASDWQEHIDNNTCEVLEYAVNEDHELRKGWGKNTWSKYQKLIDKALARQSKPYYVDFLRFSFTTEINDSPSKKTSNADKTGLNKRKSLLKESKFIQDFPIIILACSNYITNNEYVREIDEVFGVTYDGDEEGRFYYNRTNWFFVHHSKDKSKIVIHTRQLSADVKNDLLRDLGAVIQKHIIERGIEIKQQ